MDTAGSFDYFSGNRIVLTSIAPIEDKQGGFLGLDFRF